MTHPILIRRIAGTAAVALLLAVVAQTLTTCSGCGRETARPADTLTVIERAEVNLAQPKVYDTAGLANYAHGISEGAVFAPDDISTMIVLCEGAVNRMQAELDQLQRNDDPADSYGVLSEFAASHVTDNLRTVYNYLSLQSTPLTPQQAERRAALSHAIAHLNGTADEIQTDQLSGRRIFAI